VHPVIPNTGRVMNSRRKRATKSRGMGCFIWFTRERIPGTYFLYKMLFGERIQYEYRFVCFSGADVNSKRKIFSVPVAYVIRKTPMCFYTKPVIVNKFLRETGNPCNFFVKPASSRSCLIISGEIW
jgi:hypothetical protein